MYFLYLFNVRIIQKLVVMWIFIIKFARNKFVKNTYMSSFVADKIVMDGLTYDDVLLIPAY